MTRNPFIIRVTYHYPSKCWIVAYPHSVLLEPDYEDIFSNLPCGAVRPLGETVTIRLRCVYFKTWQRAMAYAQEKAEGLAQL